MVKIKLSVNIVKAGFCINERCYPLYSGTKEYFRDNFRPGVYGVRLGIQEKTLYKKPTKEIIFNILVKKFKANFINYNEDVIILRTFNFDGKTNRHLLMFCYNDFSKIFNGIDKDYKDYLKASFKLIKRYK